MKVESLENLVFYFLKVYLSKSSRRIPVGVGREEANITILGYLFASSTFKSKKKYLQKHPLKRFLFFKLAIHFGFADQWKISGALFVEIFIRKYHPDFLLYQWSIQTFFVHINIENYKHNKQIGPSYCLVGGRSIMAGSNDISTTPSLNTDSELGSFLFFCGKGKQTTMSDGKWFLPP